MGEQGDAEREKIKKLNEAIDRNLVRMMELFEKGPTMSELEEYPTDRINTMTDERLKIMKEKEEALKESEEKAMKQQKRK